MKETIIKNIEYIILFLAIIALTMLVAFIVSRIFKKVILQSTIVMKNDPTNYKFLGHAINAVIYIVGISVAIYALPSLRVLASSLLAGAGVLAVAIGFAAQHALSNVISGVFIVLFKPFSVGDRLKVGTKSGIVEDITLRHTVIKDFENQRIIIPNAVISDEVVVNADIIDERSCKRIDIGISYDANIDKARAIMQEEALKHPLFIDHRTAEQKTKNEVLAPVKVIGLGDSSVDLRMWAWASDASNGFDLICDLHESIKKRFDKEGIEIPYPHRTIIQKN